MKTSYVKPEIVIEEYAMNVHVSTCTPTTFVPPINVSCDIKSGEVHGVYDTSLTPFEGYEKCAIDDSTISTVVLGKSSADDTTYTTYVYWYGASGDMPETGSYDSSTGDGTGQALMNALEAAGISKSSGSGVLHAGAASTQLLSQINHS